MERKGVKETGSLTLVAHIYYRSEARCTCQELFQSTPVGIAPLISRRIRKPAHAQQTLHFQGSEQTQYTQSQALCSTEAEFACSPLIFFLIYAWTFWTSISTQQKLSKMAGHYLNNSLQKKGSELWGYPWTGVHLQGSYSSPAFCQMEQSRGTLSVQAGTQ